MAFPSQILLSFHFSTFYSFDSFGSVVTLLLNDLQTNGVKADLICAFQTKCINTGFNTLILQ